MSIFIKSFELKAVKIPYFGSPFLKLGGSKFWLPLPKGEVWWKYGAGGGLLERGGGADTFPI